jgi:hypothetical protein
VPEQGWAEQNHRFLQHHLHRVRAGFFGLEETPPGEPPEALEEPFALEQLGEMLALSTFELEVLFLTAAVEIDGRVSRAVHEATAGTGLTWGFVLASLPGAHWDALAARGPLRAWGLVRVGDGALRTTSTLRIDERVLDYLLGIDSLDAVLLPYLRPLLPASRTPSQRAAVRSLARLLTRELRRGSVIVVQGADAESRRGVTRAALRRLGLDMLVIGAESLPADADALLTVARAARRERLFRAGVVLVDDIGCDEAVRDRFLELLAAPAILLSERPKPRIRQPVARVDVPAPSDGDQADAWRRVLHGPLEPVRPRLGELVSSWRLDRAALDAAARVASSEIREDMSADARMGVLRAACRRARPADFGGLAERIRPRASWADLVLPDGVTETLREIERQCALRYTVFEKGGFAQRSARGTGMVALFTGESGTGKTLAAEVIAGSLGLDLCRVDLSRVMSKYIGDTEKHLSEMFDAADRGGVILLFDEADAVFGRRTEARDSSDRFANLEVSYLLQRVEAFHGLAVLTTNYEDALDKAFVRRIRFLVPFPFPDEKQRAGLWSRAFPPETPHEPLDIDRLARLPLPGGIIRNITLNAAFAAAHRGDPVSMEDVLTAARREYTRLKRPLTELKSAT